MFLPDRYVRGTCPALPLGGPVRRQLRGVRFDLFTGRPARPGLHRHRHAPVWRESDHLFFKLGAFESMLRQYVAGRSLQDAVRAKLGEWFEAGLQDWDISRDAPYFGIEMPDAPGQVLLRLVRCADRLYRQLRGLARGTRRLIR